MTTESVINNSCPRVKDNGHVRAAVEVQAYRASPKVVGASQSVWHIRGDGTVVGEGCLACWCGSNFSVLPSARAPVRCAAAPDPLSPIDDPCTSTTPASQPSSDARSPHVSPPQLAHRPTCGYARLCKSAARILALERCLEVLCIATSSIGQLTISKRNMHDAPRRSRSTMCITSDINELAHRFSILAWLNVLLCGGCARHPHTLSVPAVKAVQHAFSMSGGVVHHFAATCVGSTDMTAARRC